MTIKTLIFDLDNTLYPSTSGIWELISNRINQYMIDFLNYKTEDVGHMRDKLYREYGTTLRGLENLHHIDSIEYLKFVHDVPVVDYIDPNPELQFLFEQYPNFRKVVFTNSDRWHSERVLDKIGITSEIDQIVDVIDISPYCKPMKEAYHIALDKFGIKEASECIMYEDSPRNLETAIKLGMQGVFVTNQQHQSHNGFKQIDHINQFHKFLPQNGGLDLE